MAKTKQQQKALAALNYDLFPPQPETYPKPEKEVKKRLPTLEELYRMFDIYNMLYFAGKLPAATIEYSNRMSNAGSYTPSEKLIRIGRKYHEIFPNDLPDTLKHEMIHIIHLRHDAMFKQEAARIGATVKARSHPDLCRPPKYIYICPGCKKEYPRQKRLVMASCGDCSDKGKFDKRYKLKLYKSRKKRISSS